jgi:hypothetical protein
MIIRRPRAAQRVLAPNEALQTIFKCLQMTLYAQILFGWVSVPIKTEDIKVRRCLWFACDAAKKM